MGFIVVLVLTTLFIAASAAFFSVYGLAQIFTGSFWPVVIMASSLEVGKLVAASYLYRYWKQTQFFMKFYLLVAILILMGITSAGIFGYLSSAYQQDIIGTKTNQQQIELLLSDTTEVEKLKVERLDRKKQIDADIAALPNNFIKGRQRLMKSYGDELTQLRTDISDYTSQIRVNSSRISGLKAQVLQDEVHVGPIIYIAKVFGQSVDDATKWLILIIIFAFDPLAVALTIASNKAINERKKIVVITEELYDEPNPSITTIEQLVAESNQGLSTEQLAAALEQLSNKELSPAELAQKEMLEEMLRRKAVTEKVRTNK